MNSILDISGAFLYFIVSIVLLPLFLLTDLFLWSIVAYRGIRAFQKRIQKARARRKPFVFHFPIHVDLPLLARRFMPLRTKH
jgi:hypothetical protein